MFPLRDENPTLLTPYVTIGIIAVNVIAFLFIQGAGTNPQRYMFEESIYVLDGEGETTVWHENRPRQTFKWKKGTLFSPPLNTFLPSTSSTPGTAAAVTPERLPR